MKLDSDRLNDLVKRTKNLVIVVRRIHREADAVAIDPAQLTQAKYEELLDMLDVVKAHSILVRSKLRSVKP